MMLVFNIAAVVVFLILGISWGKSNLFNLGIKVGFFALAIWGAFTSGVLVGL